MKITTKRLALRLILCLYAIAIVVWLLVQFGGFVINRIMFANGTFETRELTLQPTLVFDDNFMLHELEYLEPDENGYARLVTTGSDPQMIFKFGAAKIESVQLHFIYESEPQMVNVYWAKHGQDYSVNNMAYAQDAAESVFWLPALGGQSLRIDPDTRPGNIITVESVVINAKRPFYSFFVPSARIVLILFIAPIFTAAVLTVIVGILPKRKAKRQVMPND